MATSPQTPPLAGAAADPVWLEQGDPYPVRDGNCITPLLGGEAYFKQLHAAILDAERSVWLLGWQINWDVMLVAGVRLYDALLGAARKNPALRIHVLPWAGSPVVATGAQATVDVIELINEELGGVRRVFAVGANEDAQPSDGVGSFFSHHQKLAVIDGRIAFVGGIDVAWGRRDDAGFTLNASGRLGNDAYNGCVPRLLKVKAGGYFDPAIIPAQRNPDGSAAPRGDRPEPLPGQTPQAQLRDGRVQLPLDGAMLDAARQPRMPWEDLQLRIEGPAVSDLASNFVLRWNAACLRAQRLPLPPSPQPQPQGDAVRGDCRVQMLRSASSKMLQAEADGVTPAERARLYGRLTQDHIHSAMLRLIERAQHFIYIENQFFISAFGQEGFGDGERVHPGRSHAAEIARGNGVVARLTSVAPGDPQALPQNRINEALGERLRKAILDPASPPPDGKRSRFHVYVTLPVHPEGMLNDPSTMTLVHLTMQSLVFGTQSLLNRVRRAILARQLADRGDRASARVFEDGNREYEAIPIAMCWPYVTLLNLRHWTRLGDRCVTEQIYVHTKAMVADDRYAIVGSANINDRSLLGNRDSELAVLVEGGPGAPEDIGAPAGPALTSRFVRALRMSLWSKLFCLDGAGANVRPAGRLRDAVLRPAAQGSWEAIRAQAEANTLCYDAAFAFIPKNPPEPAIDPDAVTSPVSIWPDVRFNAQGQRLSGLMPFDTAFWDTPQHTPAAAELSQVSGFITLLPWAWTQGENNDCGYHSALVT